MDVLSQEPSVMDVHNATVGTKFGEKVVYIGLVATIVPGDL